MSASLSTPEAGAHADFGFRFGLSGGAVRDSRGQRLPWAALRDLEVELPPGMVANLAGFPTCAAADFIVSSSDRFCSADTQVGVIKPGLWGQFEVGEYTTPLYNLEPPGDDADVIARLGAMVVFTPVYIDLRLDAERGYAVTATLGGAPSVSLFTGVEGTLWGVPTAGVHDGERFSSLEAVTCAGPCAGPVTSGRQPTAFMSNPTSCGAAEVGIAVRSYPQQEGGDRRYAPLPEISGCESVPFEPTVSVLPTTDRAAAPSGLKIDLEVPNEGLRNPQQPASAALGKVRIDLPEGVTFDVSAAAGLGACSETEIGAERDERQVVDVGGGGGPLALSFGGASTPVLPAFARADEVRAKLEALPGIAPGDLAVAGRPGGPWSVQFGGSLAATDVQLVGGIHSEMQRLAISAEAGSYTLGIGGQWSAPLPLEAEAPAVQAALEQLPAVGPGNVRVTGGPVSAPGTTTAKAFDIAFGGSLAGADVEATEALGSLTGVDATVEASEVVAGGSPVSTHTVSQGGVLRFDDEPAGCPAAAQVATGELTTPILRGPLKARLYVAEQDANPFRALLAGYLLAEGQGVLLKLPMEFRLDPGSGRITALIEGIPALPFSELKLQFKGGERGLFATPRECGTYSSGYELAPASGGPAASGRSSFTLGAGCDPRRLAPDFEAGSTNPAAGAFSSFLIRLRRDRDSASVRGVSLELPAGLAARLAGVGRCPEAALAGPAPSCPDGSAVGTVTAGLGAGLPFYLPPGRVYLGGPYRGAPISLALVLPAVAGPFDLGTVLVRVAVSLDPATAQLRMVSDPIPDFAAGIPLELRDLRILIDRPGFLSNPTACKPEAVAGAIASDGGTAATSVSSPFQAGDCASLSFRPRARLSFGGAVGRNGHPRLAVTLEPRSGDANLASASVVLPAGELLDLRQIPALCAAGVSPAHCPPRSRIGHAHLQSPLLEEPFEGSIYALESQRGLPAAVADLRAGPFRLALRGRTTSGNGRLIIRFPSVPDLPFSRLRFTLAGGRRGFVVSSESLCSRSRRAGFAFSGHNGRRAQLQPRVRVSGGC